MNAAAHKATGIAHKLFVGSIGLFTVYGAGVVILGTSEIFRSWHRHGELGHVKEDFPSGPPIPLWEPRDTWGSAENSVALNNPKLDTTNAHSRAMVAGP